MAICCVATSALAQTARKLEVVLSPEGGCTEMHAPSKRVSRDGGVAVQPIDGPVMTVGNGPIGGRAVGSCRCSDVWLWAWWLTFQVRHRIGQSLLRLRSPLLRTVENR